MNWKKLTSDILERKKAPMESSPVNETVEKRNRRKQWTRVFTVMACVVVFATTYGLILPALTIEQDKAEEMPGLEYETAFELAEDGDLLQIVPEGGTEGRIAVVVETDTDSENSASVLVLENDPVAGVQITEVAMDDPAVSMLTPEEAVQVEGLEEEVLYMVQAAEEEGILQPEEREALEGDVQESLEELGVVEDSSSAPQNDNEAQAPQTDDEAQVLQTDDDVILNEVKDLEEDSPVVPQNDIEEQAAVEDSSAAPQNDIEEPMPAEDSSAAPQNDIEVQAPQNDSVVMTGAFDCIGEALDSILLTESLQETLDGMTITARYAEGVLPEGVRMKAVEVDPAEYTELVAETTGKSDAELKTFDITFLSGDQEVQPNGEVKITFQADFIDQRNKLDVVHIADDGTAEVVESKVRNDEVSLKTDNFSVYAISYTVDFYWEVDGKSYEFSLPGGGFVSFENLVEVLGISHQDANEENQGEYEAENAENSTENAENQENADVEDPMEVPDVNNQDAAGESGSTALTLDGVVVSDATREFVADVESVVFSNPELVDVSKVKSETTVGGIKESRGLDVQYSAELTEEQIEEINGTAVEPGDWALISMQPFASEETLTVTMKTGEVFEIRVTDAQYNAAAVTSLNGASGALINLTNGNAVLNTAQENGTALRSVDVTVDGNSVTTADNSPELTEWSFTYINTSNGSNYFTISSDSGYLNISGNGEDNGFAAVSANPQNLIIQTRQNNGAFQIRIGDGTYALNNVDNITSNGYAAYRDWGWDGNRGEWFTVYALDSSDQPFPVRLHFVKENGDEIDAAYADGTAVDGDAIDIDRLNISSDGTIDLRQFIVNGYTLSNTHKSTWQDINNSDDAYRHSIIGNELRWNNGTLQYKLYYTNHDKAGWHWFNAGTEPQRDSGHWQYNGSDPGDYTAVADNDANPYDYYLVYSPVPGTSGGSSSGGGSGSSGGSLDEIGKSKTLTPNNDGTYTMDLSVTTHAKGHEESNGINLIIVFDTSSSMTRSTRAEDFHNGEYDKVGKDNQYSRFAKATDALDSFLKDLLPADNKTTSMVELALVDFNYSASTHSFGESYWTNDADAFMTTLGNLECPQGTNWAQALDTAGTVAATADNDPTYVLFMTDGAPSQYWDPSSISDYFVSGQGCYLGARDEARAVVRDGYELYGVFSFGDSDDENNAYLSELVDYAYNANVRSDHSYYASSPELLEEALRSIFGVLKEKVAHTAVNYHDGIAMDTTSTALSANVSGNPGSITYSKTGGTSDGYTVVTDANGDATFIIGGETYPGTTASIEYTSVSGSGTEAGGTGITTEQKYATVYTCTVGEGNNAKTYYMPIATLSTDSATKVGDLNWDLSPLGLLEDNATYKISFVVWPNQEAYDYVADLNNGKRQWNSASQEAFPDADNPLYYKNGVAGYPNIVYYPDTDTYAVLTNTVQEVTYYVATEDITSSSDVTAYNGQYKTYPTAPDPMPLTASYSRIQKIWNVERDPGILAQLLYDYNGEVSDSPVRYEFDILKDDNSSITTDDEANKYTEIYLGWDPTANGDEGAYVWDRDSEQDYTFKNIVTGEEHTVKIGTRWSAEFSIATGLMLSETQMTARGLDRNAYPSGSFTNNGVTTTYYILEKGHDYSITEPGLTYEFDFSAPTYHPMLVDGVLMSVNYTVKEGQQSNADKVTFEKMENIAVDENGVSSLKLENTLRGYIHLNKKVVGPDGTTEEKSDGTKFTYHVTLNNAEPKFIDDSIPWYGINSLFYHDENDNYYQAEATSAGHLSLTDEDGNTYDAACSGTFNPDIVGPTEVTYEVNGVSRTIRLYGNQMAASNGSDADGYKTAAATFKITQNQTLSIANVPVNTTYTITEESEDGYELVRIDREIIPDAAEAPAVTINNATISSSIVSNHDNHVVYTNKISNYADLDLIKVDENSLDSETKTYLKDAEFTIIQLDENGHGNYKMNTGTTPESSVYSVVKTTGDQGKVSFADLAPGYYEISETKTPDGYILISDPVYIKVAGRRITRIRKTADNSKTEDIDEGLVSNWPEDTDNSGLIRFEAAKAAVQDDPETENADESQDAANATLTVGNTPGAALPHTGGPGTEAYLSLGAMMVVGAGAVLIRRKLRRQ